MTSLQSSATFDDLLSAPLEQLAAAAFAKARAAHGFVVTYSPKVFIPLTQLCRDRCAYCTFAQAPAHVAASYMSLDEVMEVANAGRDAGCTEALFTLGERPELRYDEAARWLGARGYHSTVDYVANAAQMVLEGTGLLPHVNAGALFANELRQLREVSASQGMMLESLAELEAHRLAPDKDPERRLDTLRFAGELAIPFTTGLLVGIGETRQQRLDTLEAIRQSHEQLGHVQEVIIQNFLPKPRTAMDDRRGATRPAGLDPPPSAAEPQRRPRATARLRHRRLRGHLAGHRRPRQSRTGLARGRIIGRPVRRTGLQPGGAPDRVPALRRK
jgi:2-iminoacetate synthase ThiH